MKIKYKDYYNGIVTVDIPDDTPPELVDEVLAFFKEDYRHQYNMHRRDNRGRKLESLDAFVYEPAATTDYCSREYHMTPEEILLLKEDDARGMERLNVLTEKQRERILMLMYGFTIQDIARIEGKDHSTIAESIEAAKKKLKKSFENTPRN